MFPSPTDPLTAQPSNSLLHWIPLLKKEIYHKPPYNRSTFKKLLVETNQEKSKQYMTELCLQDRGSSPEINVKVNST